MLECGIFGHPVGHSLSPALHAANLKALGLEGSYVKIDVAPENLESELKRVVAAGFKGLNVTMPHKRAIMPFLTRLDESAKRYGAVNTVFVGADGTTTGFNTDVKGFLTDLAKKDCAPAMKRVLVLGAGGAGLALARGCRDAGAADVLVANRTPGPGLVALGSPECVQLAQMADLVVNATTLGLKREDTSVLPSEAFRAGQIVYDIVPVAHETATCRAARAAGATAYDGRGMLVEQAAAAFRIWTGRAADTAAMYAAIN